jgi:hypothetical protein
LFSFAFILFSLITHSHFSLLVYLNSIALSFQSATSLSVLLAIYAKQKKWPCHLSVRKLCPAYYIGSYGS